MIFNFTSSNIINSFLRFLGVMPKYWCMELLGFLYQTQQDTGGGMNVSAMEDVAEQSIQDIHAQMGQVEDFAASEKGFVKQIQKIDEGMVHKGAREDIEDLTDMTIQTDVASGFEGSGEIQGLKEEITGDIYDTVTQQYAHTDIMADREISQIQNQADTALAQLTNQINNIISMFVSATGQEWTGSTGGVEGMTSLTTSSAQNDFQEFTGQGNLPQANPYELSSGMSDKIRSQITVFMGSSNFQSHQQFYGNPLAQTGIYDGTPQGDIFGDSNSPGLIDWIPGTNNMGINQQVASDFSFAGPLSYQTILDLNWVGSPYDASLGYSEDPTYGYQPTNLGQQINQMLSGDQSWVGGQQGALGYGQTGGEFNYTPGSSAWGAYSANRYGQSGYGGTGYGQYSDKRLKHNIKYIGKSPKGYNVYEFEYKDNKYGPDRYKGVMSEEVQFAVFAKDSDGYDLVNYNHPDLDVEFERIG